MRPRRRNSRCTTRCARARAGILRCRSARRSRKKYPASPAAAQVKQTLDDVRAKATAQRDSRRMARLWAYAAVAGSRRHAIHGGGRKQGAAEVRREREGCRAHPPRAAPASEVGAERLPAARQREVRLQQGLRDAAGALRRCAGAAHEGDDSADRRAGAVHRRRQGLHREDAEGQESSRSMRRSRARARRRSCSRLAATMRASCRIAPKKCVIHALRARINCRLSTRCARGSTAAVGASPEREAQRRQSQTGSDIGWSSITSQYWNRPSRRTRSPVRSGSGCAKIGPA